MCSASAGAVSFFGGDRQVREQQEREGALIVIGARKVLFVLCGSLKKVQGRCQEGEKGSWACVNGQC